MVGERIETANTWINMTERRWTFCLEKPNEEQSRCSKSGNRMTKHKANKGVSLSNARQKKEAGQTERQDESDGEGGTRKKNWGINETRRKSIIDCQSQWKCKPRSMTPI